ncbi:hypothetical protein [Spirillospora sp. CA-128828]|uniref:hypothetical protein n=1 Tax=Spirillospora sp. CA-128828 TaxID=3240033 RepID=UPI003D8DA8A3
MAAMKRDALIRGEGDTMLGVTGLLDDDALESSAVVANCAMNRERSLSGSNGYGRELGFDVMAELADRGARSARVRWLDLCCGSGRALTEAARLLAGRDVGARVEIVGLDLVDHFVVAPVPPGLRLVAGSVADWVPTAGST